MEGYDRRTDMAGKGIGEEGDQPLFVQHADVGELECLLTLSGELDLASVPLVRRAVDEAVGRGRTQVSIDAESVTFIDSSGLVVLVNARNELLERGGSLRVTSASAPVTRILEIAMLVDVLMDSSGDGRSGEGAPPAG